MQRRTGGVVLATVGLIGMLSGCTGGTAPTGGSASASPSGSPVEPGPPWYDDVAAAPAAGSVGAKGTPCELPITFSLPAKWKVTPVKLDAELGDFTVADATLRCEIDAKPAGSIGFLRLWSIGNLTLSVENELQDFLADYGKTSEVEYRRIQAGPLPGVEVTFLQKSELTGESVRQRAMMVNTRSGAVLLTLGGMDTAEFEQMLPAYQLAKQSLTITS